MGHQFGEALFPSLVLLLVGWVGWQSTWQVAAATLVFIALPAIYVLMKQERVPDEPVQGESSAKLDVRSWTVNEVIADPAFWGLLISVLAPAFIGTAVFFHQDHIIESKGWNPRAFAAAYIVLAIATVTFTLIAGQLVDRLSSKVLLPIFLLPMGLGCVVLGLTSGVWGIYVFMALLGVSYGLSSALFGTIWPETYGIENLGAIRAMAVAAMVFASALGPGLTGWCIDREISFSHQLIAMGAYCLVTSLFMIGVAKALRSREVSIDHSEIAEGN